MFNGTTFTALKTSEIGCPFAGNPFIRKKKKKHTKKTLQIQRSIGVERVNRLN